MQQRSNEQDSHAVDAQNLIEHFGRDDEAIANLVGYFDVLIQMDLEQKSKERLDNEPNNISTTTPTVTRSRIQKGTLRSHKTRNRKIKTVKRKQGQSQ